MQILADGTFSFKVEGAELAHGLRPSERTPRNAKYLVECHGAVGIDSILQVLDNLQLDKLDTAVIVDAFPYPQIFIFPQLIIVCGETDIYELVAGVLVHKLGPVAAGSTWSAVAFHDYVYMSNGSVAVIRRAEDKVWATTSDLPTATAICDFNGQVIVGSPDAWV